MRECPAVGESSVMTMTVGGADTAGSITDHPLGRRLAVFAGVVALAMALPFYFLREGPPWYHLVFHLLGIAVCLVAVLLLRGIRRGARTTTLRVMTWITSVAFAGWAVGHAGELVVVLTHGGAHADHDLFQHPVHEFFAGIAVPSWLLTVLSSVVLFGTVGVQALTRRVRR